MYGNICLDLFFPCSFLSHFSFVVKWREYLSPKIIQTHESKKLVVRKAS